MKNQLEDQKFGDADQRRIFVSAMERLGETVVQHRLAGKMPIGDTAEENPPLQMAKIWLKQKRTLRLRSESRRYWLSVAIAVIGAAAAIIAAVPEVRNWLH